MSALTSTALQKARAHLTVLEKRQAKALQKVERAKSRADEKAALREHQDDKARLKALEGQNKKLYGEYRVAATSLLSLASVLRQTGGEIELLRREVDDYTRARGQPHVAAYSPRFPFPLGMAWLHYGLEDGLARFLAYRRKLEELLGWD